jgi:hypothetical protein
MHDASTSLTLTVGINAKQAVHAHVNDACHDVVIRIQHGTQSHAQTGQPVQHTAQTPSFHPPALRTSTRQTADSFSATEVTEVPDNSIAANAFIRATNSRSGCTSKKLPFSGCLTCSQFNETLIKLQYR